MKKNYYQKVTLLGVLLIFLFGFQKYTGTENDNFPAVKFASENINSVTISEFDPNELDQKQWQKLGFSEKQTETILKYKTIVGGKFTSKEQLKKCYAVSADKFAELESFILLPESSKSGDFKSFEKKSIVVVKRFNPDQSTAQDWIKMGFSEKQAEAILKYKNYLGGSFISKEKFKECFIINEENYQKLASYLILPEKTPANFKSFNKNFSNEKQKIQYRNFDPNSLDIDGWKTLGFSDKQANTIVNYRGRILRGSFKNLEDIQKCFVISAEKFAELKPFIKLNQTSSTNTAQKNEPKQEKTDFSKLDLNTITFRQLLEFGLDERSAGSMIGFRKKLGGFVNKEQILQTYNIDKDLVEKLLSICALNSSGVQKYTLIDAPEDWLKNHPYFKYSADKIIYYRVSNPDDRKIWKLLKVKPEYEARMRLYLK
ncbi:Helix-hairpin-helix motif-containing protein [Chryseobacterium soldanellicola]|uniref:Helix-hairpin-helix motif-containing protein n=1 Tax=Chryseobacterium soldanellicola TaxID=311333 RepID=A0A1H0XVN6_9FLAO|nr:helix-hairpin-helix domain-containing protein [Chryseobacterium soldanellicola]SDQ06978.1 Helix-hairpin-helix motif-containing protein [Chryseobacterium soldanellicola]